VCTILANAPTTTFGGMNPAMGDPGRAEKDGSAPFNRTSGALPSPGPQGSMAPECAGPGKSPLPGAFLAVTAGAQLCLHSVRTEGPRGC
jgi:hypothetical protein